VENEKLLRIVSETRGSKIKAIWHAY